MRRLSRAELERLPTEEWNLYFYALTREMVMSGLFDDLVHRRAWQTAWRPTDPVQLAVHSALQDDDFTHIHGRPPQYRPFESVEPGRN